MDDLHTSVKKWRGAYPRQMCCMHLSGCFQGRVHGDSQDYGAAHKLPPAWDFSEKQQRVDNPVNGLHPGNDSGGLRPDIFLRGHIQGICKCRADESHERDSGDILSPPACLYDKKCGEEHYCGGSLLVQADDAPLIPGGKVSVGKGHDRIGKAAEHPPDNPHGRIIFHGKLRDGDKNTDKQDGSGKYALFFQLFMEYERLYKSQK